MNLDAPTVQALTTVAGLALVTGLVVILIRNAWRPTPEQSDRFLPVVSVGVGVALAIIASLVLGLTQSVDLFQAVINGLVAGLGASGGYDLINGLGKAASGD